MPDRYYRARHEPPSWWDHVMAHPGTAGLALVWNVIGIMLVMIPILPDNAPSTSIGNLPTPLAISLGVFIFAGGALLGWGATVTSKWAHREWRAQIVGLFIGSLGWLSGGVAIMLQNPSGAFTYTLSFAQVVTAALVGLSVARTEDAVRKEVEEFRRVNRALELDTEDGARLEGAG